MYLNSWELILLFTDWHDFFEHDFFKNIIWYNSWLPLYNQFYILLFTIRMYKTHYLRYSKYKMLFFPISAALKLRMIVNYVYLFFLILFFCFVSTVVTMKERDYSPYLLSDRRGCLDDIPFFFLLRFFAIMRKNLIKQCLQVDDVYFSYASFR